MNNGGDAAEQIVRMSLEGVEVAAKITGNGAKNIAILLAAVLREEQKTKGKARLTNMLKSGKELKVFSIQNKDLQKFSQEAKRYGVLYCVLKDKNNKSGNASVDVIARAEDASKIQRITERFQLATVDAATVVGNVEKSHIFPVQDMPVKDKLARAKDEEELEMVAKDKPAANPSLAKTEKSPLSEPSSKQISHSNGSPNGQMTSPSVREKLNEYKRQSMAEYDRKQKERTVSAPKASVPKTKPKEM